MTLLQIMPDNNPAAVSLRTKDAAHIVTALGDVGVRFDRWTTRPSPTHPTGPEELLERYATEVDALKREGGYRLVDVVRMVPDDGDLGWPAKADEARRRFLDEHRHSEDEVRFFTNGRGCFYLHLDRHVYAVVCTAVVSAGRDAALVRHGPAAGVRGNSVLRAGGWVDRGVHR